MGPRHDDAWTLGLPHGFRQLHLPVAVDPFDRLHHTLQYPAVRAGQSSRTTPPATRSPALPLDNSRIIRIIQLFDSINRMTDTKQKILDTAERLFGDQGYAATSLRHIIAEAGVNLAAIHYHYGSKEELLDEVVMRKAGPVNAERLALLDRYEAEAGAGQLAVEKVLEAFLAPVFSGADRSPQFVKLMGRMYGEGLMTMIVGRHFQPTVTRFIEAFGRARSEEHTSELQS